jgi:hypothetical protein
VIEGKEMNGALRYFIASLIAAAVGASSIFFGLLDRRVARAEERAASGSFEDPENVFRSAERLYQYAAYLPLVGDGLRDDVRAEWLGLWYRQRRYAEIVREYPPTSDGFAALDARAQMLVINAIYRDRLSRAKDPDDGIAALATAIEGYASILRAASRSEDAAHNYEYLVKLRADVQKRRRLPPVKPPEPEGLRGRDGATAEGGPAKVYVPMDFQERTPEAPQNGDRPMKKRG